MARLHLHPVGLGLLLLGLLSWVIALGGLAATTQYCRTNEDGIVDDTGTATNTTTPSMMTNYGVDISCAQQYQLEWWAIWFEFFLLIIMLGTCFINAFDRARFIYLAYLALVTVLLTEAATNFCSKSFHLYGGLLKVRDTKQSALNAAAAGCIMMCISNYALIIFVGLGAAAAQLGNGLHLNPEAKYQPSNF